MKIIEGWFLTAKAKRTFTSFSPSPTHFEVMELADMLKKVADTSLAIALPIIVFPVPGGPNKRRPFGGARRPLNKSGRFNGQTIASSTVFFAKSNPAMSLHLTQGFLVIISLSIISISFSSIPDIFESSFGGSEPLIGQIKGFFSPVPGLKGEFFLFSVYNSFAVEKPGFSSFFENFALFESSS